MTMKIPMSTRLTAPRRCSSACARVTNSTATTARVTRSSTSCAWRIGPSRRRMDGARSSPSTKSILPREQRTKPGDPAMCSYIVEKAHVSGSAKGPSGWMRIDTANVYFDHPYHAPLDHALAIDFVCEADGARERVAVELSAASARELVTKIMVALASGEAAHRAA